MSSCGIIGSGRVGKALGKALSSKGNNILFYDINPDQLKQVSTYNTSINFKDVLDREVVFICVPTERDDIGECDLSIIESVIMDLNKSNYKGLVVQTSTCPPYTARRLSNLVGDYVVVPSFYSMARMEYDALNPVRVVCGTRDGMPNRLISELFAQFGSPMYWLTYEEAELLKYAENTLSAALISFWNELFLISKKMEETGCKIDSDKIARIIDASPGFRSVYRFNGKAYGSWCLPKDVEAFFRWAGRLLHYKYRIPYAVHSINEEMKARYGTETKPYIYRQ